jgi:hypothetical protein
MSACSVARQGEGPAVTSLIVSIVSHGHGEQVRALLHQLAGLPGTTIDGVVLTLNHAEPELATALDADGRAQPWPFQLVVHQNPHSQGSAPTTTRPSDAMPSCTGETTASRSTRAASPS